MNYGLYLSAAGVLSNMHRLDVMANNLANLSTVGFKPDEVTFMTRAPERLDPGALSMLGGEPASPQWMLEQLGGSQWVAPTRVNLRQGALQRTGNSLDVAVQGDGFFTVQTRDGDTSSESIRLTRDGRFTINFEGTLVTIAGGHRVLDDQDRPIQLASGDNVVIDDSGRVFQNGQHAATLGLVSVRDRGALVKEGDNLLRFDGGAGGQAASRTDASGSVHQFHVENSAVDPVLALNQLINASKAAQAGASLMQYHDNILGQVINTFGRVA